MSKKQTDSVFVQFTKPKFGIRVIAYLIRKYQNSYGIDTIMKFTQRWAPEDPHGDRNPTTAYATFLAAKVGVAPHAKIVLTSWPTVFRLVEGVIQFENGQQPYTRAEIIDGIKLADISVPEDVA